MSLQSLPPVDAVSPSLSSEHISTLTSGLARGDEAAFREFHRLYFARLCRYLLVVCAGNESLMRDAVQETYRRVAKYARPFAEEAIFWSWLTTLARTAASDEKRKTRRYFAFLDRFAREPLTGESDSDDSELKLGQLIETHVTSLASDEERLIRLKYYDCRPVKDIAGELGLSEGAVESKLVRIRRKLKTAVLAALQNENRT